ncbi:MAG TPA: type II TA system antitoxin MqsA family protein [Myxococcales bacterium]|jgi:putative zinc finger/helix-turn-helix YgiT family protein|nr:type II TA system antitoxin MqsA family protein [Myxococcales bacterium]
MRRCVECGKAELRKASVRHSMAVGPYSVTGDLDARRCRHCGAVFFTADVVRQFEQRAAKHLAELGAHSGETFRFMRKTLGLRAAELGGLLDVTAETISRWETGEREVDRKAAALLQAMVIEAASGKGDTRRRLELQKRGAAGVLRQVDVGHVAAA